MMTYNRFSYIKRTIESLYKRAGNSFDLFIFDDYSDKETQENLKKLQNKYKFNLFTNISSIGIYKNLYSNLKNIPNTYDYYVKLDSDVEILSDNFFPEILETFKYPEKISGITPRVEGVQNSDRYEAKIEFYGGHAIKKNAPVVYGCCFIFPNETFNSFNQLSNKELMNSREKWGIDALLYKHALSFGNFLIVEDVSVYHIDNTYGQRRIYPNYFANRKRFCKMDIDDVWYLKASKYIFPKVIDKENYVRIKKMSSGFKDFCKNCKLFLTHNIDIEKKVVEQKEESIKIKNLTTIMKTVFKITSPLNFSPDDNIAQGTSEYFPEIPVWARNNSNIVIEKEQVREEEEIISEVSNVVEMSDKKEEKNKIENPINEIIENIKKNSPKKNKKGRRKKIKKTKK